MLHQPGFTQTKPCTYEQIALRVHRIINDPQAQRQQFVVVSRLPNESPAE